MNDTELRSFMRKTEMDPRQIEININSIKSNADREWMTGYAERNIEWKAERAAFATRENAEKILATYKAQGAAQVIFTGGEVVPAVEAIGHGIEIDSSRAVEMVLESVLKQGADYTGCKRWEIVREPMSEPGPIAHTGFCDRCHGE